MSEIDLKTARVGAVGLGQRSILSNSRYSLIEHQNELDANTGELGVVGWQYLIRSAGNYEPGKLRSMRCVLSKVGNEFFQAQPPRRGV